MNITPSQKMVLWNYQKSSEIVDDASRKLSSALRINFADDDPSGLARAMNMKTAARGVNVAIQNVSDGIKMVRTVDSPLGNIQKMILRIRDLALRASNDAVLREDCQDRYKLNLEAQALIDEIDREAKALTYNTKRILSGNRVELIEPIPSTQRTIATNAFHPGWSDLDSVTYTARVEASGPGTGPRPGTVGADFSFRAFETEIDENNTPIMTTQLTSDPVFYNDADGDGFPVLVDNDDGTPVPGDATYNPAPSSTSKSSPLLPFDNIADYNLTTLIGDSVDEINFSVTGGVTYSLSYRSAITGGWTAWGNTVGTGGPETVDLSAADEVNYIRVQVQDNFDVTTDFTLTSIVNRRDRDGDGYPDIIERASDASGAEEKNGALYPFGATHAYAGGINDADGDLVPDYPDYYDDYDGTGPADPRNASQLDLGNDWTDGTGNTIIQTTPGAQYPVDVAINPIEIPSNTDTDGDTLPDPYDPFLNDVEFTTWLDGGVAYKDGGSVYFASNRQNPNDPAATAQELYSLDAGVYSIFTGSGTEVADPALSEDGTALAWEQGNEI